VWHTELLHSKIEQCVNVEVFTVLSNDGPVRSAMCRSFSVFKNIIMPLMTIVCTYWLKLQKLNSIAEK
jgi:hypothetical protein